MYVCMYVCVYVCMYVIVCYCMLLYVIVCYCMYVIVCCYNLHWLIQAGLSQNIYLHSTEICRTTISIIHKAGSPAPKLPWIIDSCRNRCMQHGAPLSSMAKLHTDYQLSRHSKLNTLARKRVPPHPTNPHMRSWGQHFSQWSLTWKRGVGCPHKKWVEHLPNRHTWRWTSNDPSVFAQT